jgi:hypothetical protein
MTLKEVRIMISPVLYKQYKILCVEKDLSIPKLTAQLIKNFIDLNEGTKKLMDHQSKTMGK